MTDQYRPTIIPPDGRPRRLDAGVFVAYLVEAADRDGAIIQAKIEARRNGLKWIDVSSVTQGDSVPTSTVRWTWTVELMIEDRGRTEI
jgi:hypothetical protein